VEARTVPASLIALWFGNFIIGAGMLVVPGILLALWQKHFSPIWSRLELTTPNSALTYCSRASYDGATNN
jgi:hypothetical protein